MSKKLQQRLDQRGIRLPNDECPTCHYKFDSATEVTGKQHRPRVGDITICLNCGDVLIFNDDMTIRQVEDDELLNLDEETYTTINRATNEIHKRGRIK